RHEVLLPRSWADETDGVRVGCGLGHDPAGCWMGHHLYRQVFRLQGVDVHDDRWGRLDGDVGGGGHGHVELHGRAWTRVQWIDGGGEVVGGDVGDRVRQARDRDADRGWRIDKDQV